MYDCLPILLVLVQQFCYVKKTKYFLVGTIESSKIGEVSPCSDASSYCILHSFYDIDVPDQGNVRDKCFTSSVHTGQSLYPILQWTQSDQEPVLERFYGINFLLCESFKHSQWL